MTYTQLIEGMPASEQTMWLAYYLLDAEDHERAELERKALAGLGR